MAHSIESTPTSAHPQRGDSVHSTPLPSPNGLSLLASAGRAAHQSPHGTTSDDNDRPRKKAKTALSCSECKRRKIKCSRTIPCEHCLKRALDCVWDEAKLVPEPQPFALNSDLLALARRTAAVEKFLQSLPPALRAGAPDVGWDPSSASVNGTDLAKPRVADDGGEMSDTEDAALELETQVFSAQPSAGISHGRFGGVVVGSLNDRRAMFAPTSSMTSQDRSPVDSSRTGPTLQLSATSLHREVTTAGTSILSAPLSIAASASASLLCGLDFGASGDQLQAARIAAVKSCIDDGPNKAFSEWAIDCYFQEAHWMHHCVQKRTFKAEHQRFWEMREQGRLHEIDPLWIASWLMVLGLTIDGYRSVRRHVQLGLPPPEGTDSIDPERLCWLAQKLMVVGDWQGRPQVRSIQCVLLFGMWSLHASTCIQPGALLMYFAGAVKMAQTLGLHSLGDDPEKMPPSEDPAWPVGKNSLKRQGAIHVWTQLLFFDWLSATPKSPTYLIDDRQCTTAAPANVNECELSATDWRLEPHPSDVLTDASFARVKLHMATAVRLTYEKLISPTANFSYEAILELDAFYLRSLGEVPVKWQREHREAEAHEPSLRWHRNIATESIHSRIVRLHRPFLTRGFNPKSKYRYSSEQALKSAKIVISSHHDNLAFPMPYWFLYSHSLGASIVLFCDLFYAIDSSATADEIESKKDTLVLAMQIFSSWKDIAAPALAAVVQTGSRIISGLFMAVERRRTLQLAGAPVKESFAQVLTRISQECAVRAVRSPLVSPTAPLEPGPSNAQPQPTPGTGAAFSANPFDAIPALGFSTVTPFGQFATTADGNVFNPTLQSANGALPQTFYNFFAESGFPSDPTQVDSWGLQGGLNSGGALMPGLGAGMLGGDGGQFAEQPGAPQDAIDWGSLAQAW